MKFAVLITTALGAVGASANLVKSYSHNRPQKHQVARALRSQQVGSKASTSSSSSRFSAAAAATAADEESVIGGAVVSAPNLLSATGTFVVPEARQPTRGPTGNNPITYGASFWVGIDGATTACATGSLRAGVDVFWDPEGTSYNAWYQLAPDRSVDFAAPLDAEPGDKVRITATAAGATNGTGAAAASVTFENLSTGLQATQVFDGGAAGLCRGEAAWVVEDFVLEQSVGMPVPLADFDNATFSGMTATAACASSGAPSPVGLEGATIFNINQPQQGGKLTDCSHSGTELVCKRIYGGA
jgi:hypothetical protein